MTNEKCKKINELGFIPAIWDSNALFGGTFHKKGVSRGRGEGIWFRRTSKS